MGPPDFNIAKFNIPISVRRAFDKGKIAESYEQMYRVAERLAASDSWTLRARKMLELQSAVIQGQREEPLDSLLVEKTKEIEDYKTQRLDYHMSNMIRMLETYVASKEDK